MAKAGGDVAAHNPSIEVKPSLLFIQWCKKLGFTLKEAQQLGALHVALSRLPAAKAMKKSPDLDSILRIAAEKIADEERKKSLGEMKRQLQKAIELLRQEAGPVCPASSPKSTSLSSRKCPRQ